MSGPKLSAAELERMRQEQLERERQEALRLLREAQKAYRKLCGRIQTLKTYALGALSGLDPASRGDAKRKLGQILGALQEEPVSDPGSPGSYEAAGGRLQARLEDAQARIQEVLGTFSARDAGTRKLGDAGKAYQTFQAFVQDLEAPIGVLQIDFQCGYDRQLVEKQLKDVDRYLSQLFRQSSSPDLKNAVQCARGQLSVLRAELLGGGDLDRIRGNLQQLVNEEEEVLRRWREKQALYDTYLALAALTDTAPRDLPEFPGTEDLRAEVGRLRQQYRKQDEMDYIADQINDAMVDLGYTFVSSHVLTRQGGGEMDHSLYQADDRTGISVFTDRSGAVMMRMTVLGDDPVITDDDRDFSYQRQIDFCAAHPELVEALAARGVYLKQKSYQEPDRKYTYKMSVSSQSRAQSADTDAKSADRPQKIDRRKRRRAGRKKMRAV